MNYSQKLLLLFLLVSAALGARSEAVVSGTVFCDQCKDGSVSMFDYPVSGVKVAVACANRDGEVTMWREETTNWAGSYSLNFDGTPDLSSCYAQVSGTEEKSTGKCTAATGKAQRLKLMFRMFGMEMYAVDSLISQPDRPMSFCSKSSPATHAKPNFPNPSPERLAPPPPFFGGRNPPSPVFGGPNPSTPAFSLPPLPKIPPMFHLPPLPPFLKWPPFPQSPAMRASPFMEASACTSEQWSMAEHKCYWKVMKPETKVHLVFGVLAARKYGRNMTLWQGVQGRGEVYRTLLREGTTALLNSYNTFRFPIHPLGVVQSVNSALLGTQKEALLVALRFKRANSGVFGKGAAVTCKFTPCK